MKRTARLAALAGFLAIGSAATAHHGWAWTEEEETSLTGTIQSISFGNPHMHLQLKTGGSGFGQGTVWEVDLSPPIVAQRSGFGPGAAEAGDEATLTGHRARDREQLAFKAERITVRGKTYDVYPDREKTLNSGG